MTDTTKNGFQEIENLIKKEKEQAPRTFPYTTRELAEMYGMSNSTVWAFLISQGLYTKGKRWFYRHNEPRHE
jgi:hypothetical protein